MDFIDSLFTLRFVGLITIKNSWYLGWVTIFKRVQWKLFERLNLNKANSITETSSFSCYWFFLGHSTWGFMAQRLATDGEKNHEYPDYSWTVTRVQWVEFYTVYILSIFVVKKNIQQPDKAVKGAHSLFALGI